MISEDINIKPIILQSKENATSVIILGSLDVTKEYTLKNSAEYDKRISEQIT